MKPETQINKNRLIEVTAVSLGMIAIGITAYNNLRSEKYNDRGENYFDILDNLDSQIINAIGPDVGYALVGGGPSEVLMNKNTRIDRENKLVIAPPEIRKDQYRDDQHKKKTDVDIVIFSDDKNIIEKVRLALTPDERILSTQDNELIGYELLKPGAKLKIGITGLESQLDNDKKSLNPLSSIIRDFKKDWVSHRLLNQDGTRSFNISDIRVDLPEEYFDTWQLVLSSGNTISIFHPLIHVLCYPSRASHGIRKRDKIKVIKIINNIGDIFGAKIDWGHKEETLNLFIENANDEGIKAALDFCEQKNALRWVNTKERLGKKEAAILAAKIAIHRQLDNNDLFVQFGQGGWLYDNFLSRLSGES